MSEHFLHQLWANQYFNLNELRLTDKSRLEILYPGNYNRHQGPDFLEARIRIDGTLLVGNIEMHLTASDWIRHAHDHDSNYKNIILHVVWKDDQSAQMKNLPTLELEGRVPGTMLERYAGWMMSNRQIPCGPQLEKISAAFWKQWQETLARERLEKKLSTFRRILNGNNMHWEELTWWMVARNFGQSINAQSFEAIAKTIPYTLLLKNQPNLIQIEAILFGQAGLLRKKFIDDYPVMLQKEYQFYKKKYHLQPAPVPIHFLRMRPVNFPTVRLAQLAVLINTAPKLFSRIRHATELSELYAIFDVTANDYWHYRFVFDQPSGFQPKKLGQTMIENILTNTVLPILFSYGQLCGDTRLTDHALEWLEKIPAEKNRILESFHELGVLADNALEAQGLLELRASYCDHQRCLECSVGRQILREDCQADFQTSRQIF